MTYWCTANSNLAYFIELTTAFECQKQLLMSSIPNLGGRESLAIAVTAKISESYLDLQFAFPKFKEDWCQTRLQLYCGAEFGTSPFVLFPNSAPQRR